MTSRSPNFARPGYGVGLWPLLGGLGLMLSGCVFGSDNDPPVLSVDFLWDRSPQSDRFAPGTCDSAGVVWMDWELKEGDTTVASSDEGGDKCEDGFDFVDVGPGHYTLTVQGYDRDDQMLWSSTCKNLVLERFDLLYQCEIYQSQE